MTPWFELWLKHPRASVQCMRWLRSHPDVKPSEHLIDRYITAMQGAIIRAKLRGKVAA